MSIGYGSIGHTLSQEYKIIPGEDTVWDMFIVDDETMVARFHNTRDNSTIKIKYQEPEIP